MAVVYIDYGLYASSDQTISGTLERQRMHPDVHLELLKTVRPCLTGARPGQPTYQLTGRQPEYFYSGAKTMNRDYGRPGLNQSS